jgi:enamine deaminase RidA (YjgF/YER057c/UK114 family)
MMMENNESGGLPGTGPFTPGKPWYLWQGPYPLEVGQDAPTNIKVWFDTRSDVLLVWDYVGGGSWVPAATSVVVGPTPPSPATLGQLYLDPQPKLWVHIDDWRELTAPISGGPMPPNGSPFIASLTRPTRPATNTLWFEPRTQDLSVWSGVRWIRIGERVDRNVRIPNPIHTWNAGGNRSQAARAGELLYVAGMRGIDPVTQQQVPGPGPENTPGTVPPNTAPNAQGRIVQIYQNIKTIVESEGLSLFDCLGIVTGITGSAYIGASATYQALPQFWGLGPYPPRTHEGWLFMSGSDQEREYAVPGWPARGDIVEVTGIFYTGHVGRRRPTGLASEIKSIPGVRVTTVDEK